MHLAMKGQNLLQPDLVQGQTCHNVHLSVDLKGVPIKEKNAYRWTLLDEVRTFLASRYINLR